MKNGVSTFHKVGIIALLTHPGGVQGCVLSLIRGLNRIGVEPEVLWDEPPSPRLLEESDVRCSYRQIRFPVSHKALLKMPDSLRYLARTLNFLDLSKSCSAYTSVFSFYNGVLVPPGLPHVYYCSGPPLLPQLEIDPPGWKALPVRVFRAMYRLFIRHVFPVYEVHHGRNYVINSKYTATMFLEAHGVTVPVVYPPVRLKSSIRLDDDMARRDSILFFSRIVDYKRPELVLELASRHPRFRCVIMGGVTPNRESYYKHLKSTWGSRLPQVKFIANPADATVKEEFARARYYVFPAVNEHFGMTTPEAIAGGAVPFVHDSGGQREIVDNERLRFSDDKMVSKFEDLVRMSDGELMDIRRYLAARMELFSEERFVKEIFEAVLRSRR